MELGLTDTFKAKRASAVKIAFHQQEIGARVRNVAARFLPAECPENEKDSYRGVVVSENYKYLDGGDDLANGRPASLHVADVVFSVIGEQAAVTGAG